MEREYCSSVICTFDIGGQAYARVRMVKVGEGTSLVSMRAHRAPTGISP
jgi:hypothetical protein